MKKEVILNINEIYPAVQGEGKSIGKPALFIRAFGCNSFCNFCDSKYAWESQEENYEMHINEVLKRLEEYSHINRWIITGGEPMLQQAGFYLLIKAFFRKYSYIPQIEWETNGTIMPINELNGVTFQYNVSPKLSSISEKPKEETFDRRIKFKAMNFYKKSSLAYFKFVVGDEQDLLEVREIQRLFGIPNEKVYLMPLGQTKQELEKTSPWLIDFCMNNDYTFSPRLHIMIYNNKRKV